MKITPIDSRLSVADQPSLSEIAALLANGTVTLINNRPDGQVPGQPGTQAEAAAAETAGLFYLHLSVTGPSITARTSRGSTRPLGVTRARHSPLPQRHTLADPVGAWRGAGRTPRQDEVSAYGRERGFDLSGAVRWLDTHAGGDPCL